MEAGGAILEARVVLRMVSVPSIKEKNLCAEELNPSGRREREISEL